MAWTPTSPPCTFAPCYKRACSTGCSACSGGTPPVASLCWCVPHCLPRPGKHTHTLLRARSECRFCTDHCSNLARSAITTFPFPPACMDLECHPCICLRFRCTLECLFVCLQDYISKCQEEGVPEAEALQLLRALHTVGVLLHFDDHPLLRNHVFLHPDDVMDAVFASYNLPGPTQSYLNGLVGSCRCS